MQNHNNKKVMLSIVFLSFGVVLLVTNNISFDNFAYSFGMLIPTLITWSFVIGAIAYFLRKKFSFIFIFSILFFLATLFDFATNVYEGYISAKYTTKKETIQPKINQIPLPSSKDSDNALRKYYRLDED